MLGAALDSVAVWRSDDGTGGRLMSTALRILIVDDDPFTRTAVTSLLESLGHVVVAGASTVPEAVYVASHSAPDVAIVDLDLGEGPTGIDLARGIRRTQPSIGIVILSTYSDPRLIGRNQAELPEGTVYVVKSAVSNRDVLEAAIRDAALYGSGPGGARSATPTSAIADLSAIQLELMRMIASGDSNAEIARRRVVSERTVEKSIQRLIKDLGIQATPEQNQRVLIAQAYYGLTGGVSARRG